MKIVFTMCEGPHDVAFLSRLLSSAGYQPYKKKVKDFPAPLGRWLGKSATKLSIQDLNVDKVYQELNALLPAAALWSDERHHMILLYSMCGDSQVEKRKVLVETLKEWSVAPVDEKEFSLSEESGNEYGLVVVYDADEKGIDARLKEIRTELSDTFPYVDHIVSNGDVVTDETNVKLGAYIFSEEESGKGTLENILHPLMKQDNEDIFNDAESFLMKHKDEGRLKRLIFKKDESGEIHEIRKGNSQYHHVKSILGIAGQLQNSGTSNTVCIEKSDYITLEKIQSNRMCQEIINMFGKL